MLNRSSHPLRCFALSVCLGLVPSLTPSFAHLSYAQAQSQTQQKKRVVVLPFQNLSQNPADEWMGLSFAENLTQRLAALKELTLLERTQIQQLIREQNFGQSVLSDPNQAPALGQMLGAQLMVIGTYQVQGDRLMIQARFVEVETGRVDRTLRYEVQGSKKDLYALQGKLATYFAEQFVRNSSEAEKKALLQSQALTQNPEAQGAYLAAQEALSNNPHQTLSLLQQAIALDPNYVLPYASLAELWASEHISAQKYGQGLLYTQPANRPKDLLQRAQAALAKAQALNADHINTQSAAAYTAYAAGQKEQALNLVKAIPIQPENIVAIFQLFTFIYFDFDGPQSLAAYQEIEAWGQRLIQQSPTKETRRQITLALFGMASNLSLPEEKHKAMEAEIQALLQETPQDLGLTLMLLSLQMKQRRMDEVQKTFNKARALSQTNGLAKMALTHVAFVQEDYPTMLALSEEAIALGFQQPVIYLSASTAHLQMGQTEQAKKILHQQIQLNPNNVQALSLLSNIETSPWLVQHLEANLQRLQHQKKTDWTFSPLEVRSILARQYKALGEWDKALQTLEVALQAPDISAADQSQVAYEISQLFYKAPYENYTAQRVRYLQTALQHTQNPRKKVLFHKALADEYSIYQNQPEQARAQLENALLLANPEEAQEVKLALASILETQQRYPEAQRLLSEILALPQPPVNAYYEQAKLLAVQEDYTQAAQFMALFLEKDSWASQRAFYQNLYKSYLIETRLQEEIRTQKKPRAQTLNDLAVTYIGMEDWDSAVQLLQFLVKEVPDNATFHYNLGTAYLGQKQWEQAEQALFQAVQHQENYPAAWYNLAIAQLQAGKHAAARSSVIKLKLLQADYPGLDALTQQMN